MSRIPVVILRGPTVSVLARPQFVAPAHLPVQCHGDSTDGERLAEYAGRLRSDSLQNPAERDTREYLAGLLRRTDGHLFAHAHYTLLLEGVSQSLVTELVQQHGAFAYSQRPPRPADDGSISFVMPPAVIGDLSLELAWTAHVSEATEHYSRLADALMTRFGWVNDRVQRRTLARDGALGVLPNSVASTLIMTGNAQTWRELVERHAIEGSELEMRRMALAIWRIMRIEEPTLLGGFAIHTALDRWDALRTM